MKEAVLRLIAMASDRVFGAQLSSQFDLTLLFEHAILTVLPATLLIVASPFYLFHYLKSPAYVSGGGRLSWAKLVSHHHHHHLSATTCQFDERLEPWVLTNA